MHTGIFHTLDFEQEGKFIDYLSIPCSVNRSPYYQVKVPVCRIKNGEGPRILLMAGNHGDEYEGEICLTRLIRELQPENIKGEVTILPFANTPAVMAAQRCSPLDSGNLNRSFPGNPDGSPTERIAYFLEHDLFPHHDVLFDIHSGGTSMAHLTCGLIEVQEDEERQKRAVELLSALGLPYAMIANNGPHATTSMGAARRAGIIGLSGEFGGGGTVTPKTISQTAQAINNLLIATGIINNPVLRSDANYTESELIRLDSHDQAIYASHRGWFEPAFDIGDKVESGDIAGWYHDFSRVELKEETLRFKSSGVVISRRLNSDCESGDCLIQVGCYLKDS